ncbi:SdpI family protein [Paenibacillus sp. MER 99-2]|uniref:SdpI family protein n=1 Tax=Paenibacillus sp. MER 99-2 TaxID=2939572 RepID=UPI00203D69EE|nr:SdpI family protein [Paenibacillus sp. MER 99-2]MCM3175745.1 SdpI family protein [Paenibacillus sp. MER 99-2]
MAGSILGIICGVCYFILGFMMFKKPPRAINGIYGYRTPRAMSDPELWKEAQHYASNLMMQFGFIILVFGILGFWFTEVQALILSLGSLAFYTIRLFVKVEGRLKELQSKPKKKPQNA